MKLIRFAQSTLLVSNASGGSLLLDPGQYNLDPGRLTLETCPVVDVIIITHKHADHFHLPMLQAMLARRASTVITNSEIAGVLAGHGIAARVFVPGDTLAIAGFDLQCIQADHVVRGELIENFGVVVSADNTSFYHTSDTRFMDAAQMPDAVKGTTVFVPISNRGVVMGIDDAAVFAKDINASLVVPIHYDSPKDRDRVNPDDFARYASALGLNVKVLAYGESLSL